MADSEQIARKRSIREKQLIKTKSRNVVGMVEIIAEDARETVISVRFPDGKTQIRSLDSVYEIPEGKESEENQMLFFENVHSSAQLMIPENIENHSEFIWQSFLPTPSANAGGRRTPEGSKVTLEEQDEIVDSTVDRHVEAKYSDEEIKRSDPIDLNDLPAELELPGGVPKRSEFDYQVVFHKQPLGLELEPASQDRNAIVSGFTSDFAAKNVHIDSLLIACNNVWLISKSIRTIESVIVGKCETPPVTLRFRAKRWMKSYDPFATGVLDVRVVSAHDLFKTANKATVEINGVSASTFESDKKSKSPNWDDILSFRNFDPTEDTEGTIKVKQMNKLFPNQTLGTATFSCPSAVRDFVDLQNLEVSDADGNLVGFINVQLYLRPFRGVAGTDVHDSCKIPLKQPITKEPEMDAAVE